jgi:tetratricopeptide (TPR) repeat protein
MHKGQYDDAIEIYSRLLENNPRDSNAYLVIGTCYYTKYKAALPPIGGQERVAALNKAVEYCNKANDRIIEEISSYKKDIASAEARGEIEKARKLEQHLLLNLNVLHANILVHLGDIAYDNKSYLEAARYYEKAVNSNPFNLTAWFKYALAAEELPGAERVAVDLWERFLTLAKGNSGNRERYGITDEYLKRAEEGIKKLDKRIEEAFEKEKRR